MKLIRMAGVVALAAIVHLATASAASAQLTSGQVYGTIHDAQGAAIPGATLVLISEGRGTRTAPVVTSATGDFVFPTITPDTYTLEAAMSGFKTVKRPGIQVSAGDRIAIPTIVLEVGGQTETVNVTAESPTIQAQSGERSFTITTEQVQNLPLQSRSFFNLALMAPASSDATRPLRRTSRASAAAAARTSRWTASALPTPAATRFSSR